MFLAVGLLVPAVGAGALTTGTVERVSVAWSGAQSSGASYVPSTSADGRFVAFQTDASNLVIGDTNGHGDIYVRDRQTGATGRVSLRSTGGGGDGDSWSPAVSGDGQVVAFASTATDLVPGDTNGVWDVFVRDRGAGTTARVSVASGNVEATGDSTGPSVSGDGRYVAFVSMATDLVVGDTNSSDDVFVHDRVLGTTTRVSVPAGGGQSNNSSGLSSISADGRYVAFLSDATNLVPGDTNGAQDIFVRDRVEGTTTRVSVASDGSQVLGGAGTGPAISADGRHVVFGSSASSLVPGDSGGHGDIFVHDRQTQETSRVSVTTGGTQGNDTSSNPSLSPDGGYVAFTSEATNLVPGDTNGDSDVFLHELSTGITKRVSVGEEDEQADNESDYPSVSENGAHVAYGSEASNLVPGDTNARWDIFVWSAATVPDAPTSVAASGGDGEATVSWSTPGHDGDSPITGYTVTTSPGGDTTTVGGGQTSTTVDGLTNGTAYTFTVVATNVVGDSPPSAPSNTVVPAPVGLVRQSGGDRTETAVAISKATFDPGVATVYLATALDFPDALAGGPRAAADGAPILLTFPDRLPQATADELVRLTPDEVVILGGPVAVHAVVADEVDALGGWDVDRLFGGDRFATAAAVADTFGPVDRVLVATGREFPDALAGGVLAAPDAPILLTERDRLPAATREAISDLAPDEIVLLGGTVAVGEAVALELSAMVGGNLERLWGPDRFATAAAIADEFPVPSAVVYVATGLAFPDALAGVPAAARYDAPLLLVRPDELPQATIDALERLQPAGVVVLGGPTALSAEVATQLATYLGAP